jgi:hypothetical protein
MAKIFALAIPPATFERVRGRCVDLADQRLAPSADRRNVVELWRVRELKEFERCFSGYRADFREGA